MAAKSRRNVQWGRIYVQNTLSLVSRLIFKDRRAGKLAVALSVVVALSACMETTDQAAKKTVVDDTLRNAALEAEAGRNYVAALSHYRKLWADDSANEAVFMGIVRNLRYLGSAKEGVRFLLANKEQFESRPAYHLEFGKSLIAAEQSRAALKHLTKAIDLEPENWQIYSTMGIAFDRLELFRKARDAYELALELSPENPKILNNLAISAAMGGDIKTAIDVINKAARLDRNNVQIRQNLALFLGIDGDTKNAEALARMDLDEDAVRNNLSVFESLRRK